MVSELPVPALEEAPKPVATDVVLFIGRYHLGGRYWLPRHCDEPVELGPGLSLRPMGDLAESVLDACEPPGKNMIQVVRQYGSLYAYVREQAPFADRASYIWDPDRKLQQAIQLSQIAKPTTVGLHLAARIIDYPNGKQTIAPVTVRGLSAESFIVNVRTDGLRNGDVTMLRRLLKAFDVSKLPNRVRRAMWLYQYVTWTHLMEVRWALLGTALEALVHVDERRMRRGWSAGDQFVNRLDCLRQFVRGARWSRRDLGDMYDLRSTYTHARGAGASALLGRPRRLYLAAERGLRAILRRAILNENVADIFRSDSSVRTTLGFRQ